MQVNPVMEQSVQSKDENVPVPLQVRRLDENLPLTQKVYRHEENAPVPRKVRRHEKENVQVSRKVRRHRAHSRHQETAPFQQHLVRATAETTTGPPTVLQALEGKSKGPRRGPPGPPLFFFASLDYWRP